jgi:hypothetical protein
MWAKRVVGFMMLDLFLKKPANHHYLGQWRAPDVYNARHAAALTGARRFKFVLSHLYPRFMWHGRSRHPDTHRCGNR